MSKRRLLLAAAALAYLGTFAALVLFETPGLGIGRFFNVAVVLLALATGFRGGILGGALATGLYTFAVLLSPKLPTADIATMGTAFRLASFVAVGGLIGWFASTNRSLMDELRLLADRDSLTGLPNTRAFEAAISRRLESGRPFALLVGDMDSLKQINIERGGADGNDALRRLADLLARSLGPDDELARVGGDEFAVLSWCGTGEESAQLASRLEFVLSSAGCPITFGWATRPNDGDNALSLYRAADERLYARKLVRGYRRGSAGVPLRPVVDEAS